MGLLDKLRKRAKELDAKVKLSLTGVYDFQSGDDRDLLEAAIKYIEGQAIMPLPPGYSQSQWYG